MRGKAKEGVKMNEKRGITPAYAGKSFSVEICLFRNEDHPRLCGEKARIVF